MNIALSPPGRPAWFPGRLASANVIRVLTMCAAFAALLTFAIHSGRDLTAMLQAAFSKAAFSGTAAHPALESDAVGAPDPVAAFPRTHVGHLLFASYGTDMCRRVLFDNRTGVSAEAGHIYCGQSTETAPQPLGQERAQALLRSFRK